jgi:hypothetical protein
VTLRARWKQLQSVLNESSDQYFRDGASGLKEQRE